MKIPEDAYIGRMYNESNAAHAQRMRNMHLLRKNTLVASASGRYFIAFKCEK